MDTDVIIILMAAFHKLVKTQSVADVWVAFGMGKSYRFLSINAIFDSLGKQKAQALPLFHALTGSDTTQLSKGRARNLPGKHGRHLLKLQIHLCIFLCTLLRV